MIALSAVALAWSASADFVKGETFNEKDISVIEKGEGSETTFSDVEFTVSAGENVTEHKDEPKGANLAVKTPLANPDYFKLDDEENLNGIFFDSVVKFTYCDEDAAVPDDMAKLMVWVKENPDDATDVRLMVTGGKINLEAEQVALKIYDCGPLSDYGVKGADDWCRLTLKARADLRNGGAYQGFVVFVNGQPATLADSGNNRDIGLTLDQLNSWDREWARNNQLIPSIQAAATTLSRVGFAGQGAVDNIAFTTTVPTDKDGNEFAADIQPLLAMVGDTEVHSLFDLMTLCADDTSTATITFMDEIGILGGTLDIAGTRTLDLNGKSLDAEALNVSGTLTITGDGKVNCQVKPGSGASVIIKGGKFLASQNQGMDANDQLKSYDPENFELKQIGSYWELVEIFENGTEAKPWLINGVADLIGEKSKIVLGAKGAGVFYKLTQNIALTEPFDGIGARDLKDTLGSDLAAYTSADVFEGNFDGNGCTISGVILKTGDYIGFFNSCNGATIKNLKLSLGNEIGWSDDAEKQVGAVFVGVSVDTTIENCQTVVDGTFDTFKASKTAAGFVGYAANGTVIKDCVNNLNIWSAGNEKAGGFVACAQAGKSTGDGVVIDGCTNKGNVQNGSANPFLGGLVGYMDLKTTYKGQNVVSGDVTAQSGAAKSIGHVNNGSITIEDGVTFTVPAGILTVNKIVDGLNYATVEGDVATLVKDEVVDGCTEKGAMFKVMTAGNKPQTYLWTHEEEDASMYIYFDETLAGIAWENSFVIEAGFHAEPVATLDRYTCYGTVIEKYTITYMYGDEPIALQPETYTVEDEVTLPTELEGIEGVQLVGWYDTPDLDGNPVTMIDRGETGDRFFFAKVELQGVEVTVPIVEGGEYFVNIDGQRAQPAEEDPSVGGAKYLFPIGSFVDIWAEAAPGYTVNGDPVYVIGEVREDTTLDPVLLPEFVKLVPVTVPVSVTGGEYGVYIGGTIAEPVEHVAGGEVYLLPVGSRVQIVAEPAEGYTVVGENPYVIEEVKEDTTVDIEDLPRFVAVPTGPTSDSGTFGEPDPKTGMAKFTPAPDCGSDITVDLNGFEGRVQIPVDKIDMIRGVQANQLFLTVNGVPVDNKYFKGEPADAGVVFSTELSNEAAAEYAEEAPFTIGDNVDIKIKPVPGLSYVLSRSTDLSSWAGVDTATAEADSDTLTLTDSDKPAEKAFYKVITTKQPLAL